MSINPDIYLDQPIVTLANRAAQQVDVTEQLLSKYFNGFVPGPELLAQAVELGIDVDAVIEKVRELTGEEEDDY